MKAKEYVALVPVVLEEIADISDRYKKASTLVSKIAGRFLKEEKPNKKYPDGKLIPEQILKSKYREMFTKWRAVVAGLAKSYPEEINAELDGITDAYIDVIFDNRLYFNTNTLETNPYIDIKSWAYSVDTAYR